MMDRLRATTNHIVLKIILLLIILSFLLTGVGGYLTASSDDFAVKVNQQEISKSQLEQTVQRESIRLQQQFGKQFSVLAGTEGYIQHLRQQTLEQLINTLLIEQYTHKLALTASDEQVKTSIRQLPYFQTDKQFDNGKYRELVQRLGYTPEQFAQLQRQQLISKQLLQAFGDTEFVLPAEVQMASELILQQRDVRLITIGIDTRKAEQTVTDEELKTWYQQNTGRFIAPEELKISYIALDPTAIRDKIAVTDADINSYYVQHKSSYTQPVRKNFSVIQLNSETEAQLVLETLQKGADFAAVAREKSADIIARKSGGNLGWFEPDNMAEELTQASLTIKGELSAIIKSSAGYLIVRLNDVKPEKVKALAEVRTTIAEQVKQKKFAEDWYALQRKVADAAGNDSLSLASAEQAAGGVKATTTEWFTRDTVPAGLNFRPVLQAIFDGSLTGSDEATGRNSDVIVTEDDRAFVLRINGHKPQGIQPFDQVKLQVTELVKRQKALQLARAEGEKLLGFLKQGTGDEALKAAGLNFGETKRLSRIPGNEKWVQTAFALPHPQKAVPSYGMAQDDTDNIVLIELQSVIPGHLPAEEVRSFTTQTQDNLSSAVFDALTDNLRSEATVKLGSSDRS